MRYENKFIHQINIDDNVDIDAIEIPALIIQPFVENSIKHGFKNINHLGKINISIQKTAPKILTIIIQDNGKGIENIEQNDLKDVKKKSLSLEIIQMQLAIISKQSGIPSYYNVKEDTEEKGVKVVLQIGIV